MHRYPPNDQHVFKLTAVSLNGPPRKAPVEGFVQLSSSARPSVISNHALGLQLSPSLSLLLLALLVLTLQPPMSKDEFAAPLFLRLLSISGLLTPRLVFAPLVPPAPRMCRATRSVSHQRLLVFALPPLGNLAQNPFLRMQKRTGLCDESPELHSGLSLGNTNLPTKIIGDSKTPQGLQQIHGSRHRLLTCSPYSATF